MKLFPILFTVLICTTTFALESFFPSSIPGVTIPNAHFVGERVIRGNSPMGRLDELESLRVTEVVIFKNATGGEVAEEISALHEMGFTKKQIHHIPFKWKDIDDYGQSCTQVIEALRILINAEQKRQGTVFFHCTVGEDRTGLLAGVFRMLNEGWSTEQAFRDELCARGYEAANPKKPKNTVVKSIRTELTPLFLALANLVENGDLKAQNLDESVCENLELPANLARRFTCGK